jgi:alpha-1,3-mannosyltransferase
LNRVFHGDGTELPSFESVQGVKVWRVPFIGRRRFFLPLVSPSFLNSFDVIHVHNTDVFFDYISLLGGVVKTPVFATTHGGFFHTSDYSSIKKIYFNLITRNTGRRYRVLFATSQNDFDTFGGVNDNLVLKPNAIQPPGDFLADGRDFVYIGRLAKYKNVAALVKVFARLKKNYRVPGKLHIIGPEWDVKAADLELLAEELDVGEDVMLHGFVTSEELQKILKSCGWFFSASSYEGFGMSMLEAMAVGLVPYVQPNGSFRELVAMGGVGACIDFTMDEEAAEEIANHLKTATRQDREKARRFALLFSWEKLARETIHAYREYG